jgi:type II secretory pathway pseudopilin PulG
MRIIPKKLTEQGDTIVEVLIAIGVLSLILGGAFILTNRSLQSTRSAQERLNATKLVETQLEQIKNLAATNGPAIFGASVPASFCINNSGQVKSSSDAGCTTGVDGLPSAVEPKFSISITRIGNIFKVKNSWNSITGTGQEVVEMSYKVYDD